MEIVTLKEIAKILKSRDNYEILTHVSPDGDTLGSAFALCEALQSIGKKAKVITVDEKIPKNYLFMKECTKVQEFDAKTVISVDVAAPSQLGKKQELYENKITICIDHHEISNIISDYKYLDAHIASTAEIIYELLLIMKIKISINMANAIYIGVSTDTGCFKYPNTTASTHLIAAKLIELGCDYANINRIMFDSKSQKVIKFNRLVQDTIEFFNDGKIAIMNSSLEMKSLADVGDEQLEDLSSFPRQIDGVLIGITIREKEEQVYKVSVRTNNNINAAKFCAIFGGGGHMAAAGCTLRGFLDVVKNQLISEAERFLVSNAS